MLGEEVPGRADILATKASESVAVEIETGKSDAVWNVKQDLLAHFRKILVVATDRTALEKVERELARAGLLGLGGRVELRLAGENGSRHCAST